MSGMFLVLASFLASAVEMVEALTIVLAVGVTRGWRSPLIGVGAALLALALIIAALGPALTIIPIEVLRLVVGLLLLTFGLQWLRKAILRASGYKALHDENAAFQEEVAEARAAGPIARMGMDWYGFTLSFKGVFLEVCEVDLARVHKLCIAVGSERSTQHWRTGQFNGGRHSAPALLAHSLVGLVGLLLHRPLSGVPENTMKFAVGVMLTTFGIFWGAEGTGVEWPGGEVALLALVAFVLVLSLTLVRILEVQRKRALASATAP